MSESISEFNAFIQWPDGIDEQRFLDEYWQKKPLLIRQAFPDFESPLPADELAGLSLEPDTTGKIITRDAQGAFTLEYGPFNEDRFSTLTGNDWSLLVTDVEKHIHEFVTYLQPFRFIADWRIDDLMISYAPDGASVGAHVDEYDVFLLQGTGIRTWSIDERHDVSRTLRDDGDLKILSDFQATDTWDLHPGDMLYLPPDLPHHGIAKGDECTTWSIGFRAPRLPDLIPRLSEMISESLPPVRYSDGPLSPATHGEISDATIKRFHHYWQQATQLSHAEFAQLVGCWLTESNSLSDSDLLPTQVGDLGDTCGISKLQKAPFSRFAWSANTDNSAMLFVDGISYQCSTALAHGVCSAQLHIDIGPDQFGQADMSVLDLLITSGSLLRV